MSSSASRPPRTWQELASLVSAWILSERPEWRKRAYAIAHSALEDAPLQSYLLGLIEGADGEKVRALRESLDEEDWSALRSTTLPACGIWGDVAADVVMTVGRDLRPGEYREVMDAFAAEGLEGRS